MEDLDRNQPFGIAWLRVAPALLTALVLVAVALPALPAFAHGGGLNSDGCHTNSRTSDYHCHRHLRGRAATPREARQDPC